MRDERPRGPPTVADMVKVRKGACMFEGLFQPMHLLVIFGIALLVFGPKKLPELGKGLGDGIRGFKSAMKETVEADDKARGS